MPKKKKNKNTLSEREKHVIFARAFTKPYTLFYKQTGIWLPDVIAEQEKEDAEKES